MSDKRQESKAVSRRQAIKYGVAGVVVVGAAAAGAYYYSTIPPPTPTPTSTAAATTAAATTTAATGAAALGATPYERALNGAKKYVLENNVPTGTVLTVYYPSGTHDEIASALPDFEAACQGRVKMGLYETAWEDMYAKMMEEAVGKTGAFDVAYIDPANNPDYYESGLIHDLTAWYEKYDPEVDHGPCPVPDNFWKASNRYKDMWVSFKTDNDAQLLFYRTDKFNDPDEQKAFESQFGYSLHVPNTWKEFDDLAKFFYRPNEPNKVSGSTGFWGYSQYRVPYYATFEFVPRYYSKGGLYFDDNMHPLIDSPQAIETVNDMVAVNKYLWPGSWTQNYTGAYAGFANGEFLMHIEWTSIDAYSKNPSISKIPNYVGAALTPGTMVNGKLQRAIFCVLTRGSVVSNYGKYPELAYLFLQYHNSSQEAAKWLTQEGWLEPFRTCLYDDPGVRKHWGDDLCDIYKTESPFIVSDIGLRGAFEYTDNLDKALLSIHGGLTTPEKGLKGVHDAWEEITDRYGRDQQIAAWLNLKSSYPPYYKGVYPGIVA